MADRRTVPDGSRNGTAAQTRDTAQDPVALVEDRFKERRKWVFERQWFISMAYYAGLQWVEYNDAAKRLDIPPAPSWRVRHVSNEQLPIVNLILGSLLKNKPDQTVVPASAEEKAVNAAKASSRYLSFLWRKLEMDDKLEQLLIWAIICGTSFLKVYWDKDQGRQIPYKQGDDGKPRPVKDSEDADGTLAEGEVGVDVISPFEFIPDPTARDLGECEWVMVYRARDVKWIKRNYGVDVSPENDVVDWNMYDARVVNLTSSGERLLKQVELQHSAVVKEMWVRPTDEHPDGRLVIVAGGKMLYDGPNPYSELKGDLPFCQYTFQRVPGRFWGMGVMEPLLPILRQHNKAVSDLIENKNLMARPQWIAPKGSLRQGAIVSKPGTIVEYVPTSPGVEPHPVAMPNLPAYALALPEQLQGDLYTVSGQINFAGGLTGVRSAMAMAMIMEQQSTRMGPAAAGLERAIARCGKIELACMKEFYTEKRTGLLMGRENAWEAVEFDRTDVADDAEVVVQQSSALPQDKLAKQQFVLSLWQQGIVPDPTKILRLLDLGDVEEIFSDINQDATFAQFENEQLRKGKEMPVEDYQNHATHIYEHNRYRKTLEFYKLPDERKAIFAAHVQGHQAMLRAQQAQQQPPQEIKPGGPQPPGPVPEHPPLPPMAGQAQGVHRPPVGDMFNPQAAFQAANTAVNQGMARAQQ